jgi:hypothetical protein
MLAPDDRIFHVAGCWHIIRQKRRCRRAAGFTDVQLHSRYCYIWTATPECEAAGSGDCAGWRAKGPINQEKLKQR